MTKTTLFKNFVAGVAGLAICAGFVGLIINNKPEIAPAVVYSSPGGSIFEFIDSYNKMGQTGQKLEIRGVCASACTFFLGLVPKENVCYSDRAYLGFHGVYSGGLFSPPTFNQPMTEWTYNYVYPQEVIEKLNTLGWSMEHDVDTTKYPTGMIWQKADFLKGLGYKKCEDAE